MKIKLGDQDSNLYFKYKIGDKVRSKYGSTAGTITGGNCYPDSGPDLVYYIVKMQNGLTQTYRQKDIELLRIRLAR